jgi:ketosteroid isomerase-like protein
LRRNADSAEPALRLDQASADWPGVTLRLDNGGMRRLRACLIPLSLRAADKRRSKNMKTLEEQVREIADREEIKELTAKYAHWVALGEGARVAQLFTDDGAFINEIMGQKPNIDVRGRQQLDEFYPRLKRGMALPCIHNHIIEINGDSAKGTCTIEVRITQNKQSIIGSGYYADNYRRVNDQWKFAERHAYFYHFVPLLKGWTENS